MKMKNNEQVAYKVVADKEYFESYGEIAQRVKSLGGLFQNSNGIASKEELIEWQDIADKTIADLEELIYEAQNRIVLDWKTNFNRKEVI